MMYISSFPAPSIIPRLLSNDISGWMESKTTDSFLNFSTRDTIRRKRGIQLSSITAITTTTTFDSLVDRSSFRDGSNFSKHDRKLKEEKHSLSEEYNPIHHHHKKNYLRKITNILFSRKNNNNKKKRERKRKEMNAFRNSNKLPPRDRYY